MCACMCHLLQTERERYFYSDFKEKDTEEMTKALEDRERAIFLALLVAGNSCVILCSAPVQTIELPLKGFPQSADNFF